MNRGYCPACGFYANRKDRIHYHLNESHASRRLDARYGKKLEKQLERREKSHQRLHNDFKGTSTEVIKARREAEARKKAIQQTITYRGMKNPPLNTMQSKTSGKGFLIGIFIIALVIAAALAVYGEIASYIPDSWSIGGTYEEPAQYDSYPDEEINMLAETGDDFEILLTGGKYVVGVHIPEGLYKITLVEGEGALDVTDDVNNISVYEWFELDEKDEETDEDEEYHHITELDEVRLFDGAHITVYPGVVLSFETHNGQTAQMSVLENPLTDVFHVPKGTTLVCGVDFEPGVYDIQSFSNNGLLTYSHPYYWLDDGEFYDEFLWLDEGMTYQNIVLLEGTEISSDFANFTLIPSPKIGNIDYDTYYDHE